MADPKLIKWTDRYIEMAFIFSASGISEAKQAELMGVSLSTYNQWKKTHKEFARRLNDGKLGVNSKVVESAINLCTGFEYEEEVATYDRSAHKWEKTTIKKMRLPDPWSVFRWLSLKMRDEGFSETQRVQIDYNANISISTSELSTEFLAALEKEARKLKNVTDIEEIPQTAIDAGDDN